MVENSNVEEKKPYFAGNFDLTRDLTIASIVIVLFGMVSVIGSQGLTVWSLVVLFGGLILFLCVLWWSKVQPWRTRGLWHSDATPRQVALGREIAREWEETCIFACLRLVSADGTPQYPGLANISLVERKEGQFLTLHVRRPEKVHVPLQYFETMADNLKNKYAFSLVKSEKIHLEPNKRGVLIGLPVVNLDHTGIEKL